MTTAQEPLAGPFSPPPCSLPNSEDRSKNSTNNATDAAPASAANVYQQDELRGAKEVQRCQFADPTRIGVPSSDESQQQDELSSVNSSRESHGHQELSRVNKVEPERGTPPQPSADRCQFSFSDGRQCRMPRAQHHAYLCAHHASKEELGCGAPALPELEALCGDLSTATNINRAVTQVFRLLAQGRISRRDALAFGSLARLLLHTLPAIRRESIDAFGSSAYYDIIKSKLTTRPALRDQQTSPQPPPLNKVASSGSGPADAHPAPARPAAAPVDLPPPAPRPAPPPAHPIRKSEQETPLLSPDRPMREGDPLCGESHLQDELSPLNSSRESHGHQELSRVNKVSVSEARFMRSGCLSGGSLSSLDSSPAAAPPGIAKPRFVWIERLQRLIPESSLQ